MKPSAFEYRAVVSIEEAVDSLSEHGDDAKVLAGGQSLVPLLALRLARPEFVIDINGVTELTSVSDDDGLRLGALVRHRTIERSSSVMGANPLLSTAASFVGHAAIRNRGTIGGSIAHGDPAAELPTVLIAMDGMVELTSRRGTRTVAATDFFQGFLSTALESDELLSAVRFPAWPPGAGWSFQEFSRRSGDFAVVGVAAVLRVGSNGLIDDARVALSGVAGTPLRARAAEELLLGAEPSEDRWAEAGWAAAADLEPPSDLHGTSAYRRHLAGILVRRALEEAYRRAERPS
jgi:carbon-monoxide dehydrogenase medium subunit